MVASSYFSRGVSIFFVPQLIISPMPYQVHHNECVIPVVQDVALQNIKSSFLDKCCTRCYLIHQLLQTSFNPTLNRFFVTIKHVLVIFHSFFTLWADWFTIKTTTLEDFSSTNSLKQIGSKFACHENLMLPRLFCEMIQVMFDSMSKFRQTPTLREKQATIPSFIITLVWFCVVNIQRELTWLKSDSIG